VIGGKSPPDRLLRAGWVAGLGAALATRLADALAGPVLRGYDAVGHVSYVFFLDLYRALPFADQGWSYFHPPLHYLVGWALAQTGSPDLFVRGLALWNAAAGLAIALLTAGIVRRWIPGPRLAWLAFVSVVFLPVLVYSSPTPGNEVTMVLFGTAALANHLANQTRPSPGLARDALTGALAGAALLAKFNGVVNLLAITAALVLGALRPGLAGPARRRRALRAGVVVGVAGLVCGGFYARNLAEFGTPFPLAGHRPVVDAYESQQPPGQRGWRDAVCLSPRLLLDPSPLAPHMLHSIWGSLYASLWVHLDRHGSNLPPAATRLLLALGLAPTLLVAWGLGLAARGVWRDPRAEADAALSLLVAGGLAGFAAFAFATPTFAALKAAYLLNLAPAWGYGIARGAAGLARRPGLARAAGTAVVAAAAASAFVYTPGLGLPPAPESVQMAPVRSHFGDWEGARALYRRELEAALRPEPADARGRPNPFWAWGMLAGVELLAGRASEARALYAESFRHRPPGSEEGAVLGRASPTVVNRLAVATALAGDPAEARRLLDAALAVERLPELLVNRAALRALAGDLDGAEAELREALSEIPGLAPGLHNLARVRASRGDPSAGALLEEARRAALAAPRGYPYGIGDGRGLNTQLFMLELQGGALALYRPGRARG
jgi:tetratricopeptide (TPR) repeat protein